MKRKLKLNRETLRSLNQTSTDIVADQSCCDSCYFVSCGGGCGISTGLKGD
jgi:hypothetical protein